MKEVNEFRELTSCESINLNFKSLRRLTAAPRDQSTVGVQIVSEFIRAPIIRMHVPKTTFASLSVSRRRFFIAFIQFVTSKPSERP